MSTPNTSESESHLTSADEVAANYSAALEHTSEIIADIGGVREVSSILNTPTTVDPNESEQLTIAQLLQAANLPENTPVVKYTNSYKSAAELVQALKQTKEHTNNDGLRIATSELVDQKLASSQAFINKVDASIAERNIQPETFFLATVTVADLGFSNGATFQQIQNEIRQRKGVEFCKLEDAVIDHINDTDLRGNKLFMLNGNDITNSTPEIENDMLSDSDGRPRVFSRGSFSNGSGRFLDASWVDTWLRLGVDARVVLRLIKSDSDASTPALFAI